MTHRMRAGAVLLALSALIALGCATPPRQLMPTPALYLGPTATPVLTQPAAQLGATTAVNLLYITNRGAEQVAQQPFAYGQTRARNLAFGSVRVRIGPYVNWETLLSEGSQAERTQALELMLGPINELGRFPNEPYGLVQTSDGLYRDELVMEQHRRARDQLGEELAFRVSQSERQEVMLYVHGFNETFATAAFTAAELCHYLGRESVCAFFTWPASSTGDFLTSYTSTTESATFAVAHLKKTIRQLASTPGVERLQLLAHSRGTALLLEAVRSLSLESIAAGQEPVDSLKIDNLVLFSPDIDIDIAGQELTAFISDPDLISVWPGGRVPQTLSGRLTIYASPQDRALLVSKLLFRSRARVGELRADAIPQVTQEYLAKIGPIDIIIYEGERTDAFGHSYFTTSPQVSTDVIQLLRFGRAPGEPGRELVKVGPVVWTFN